MDKNVTRYQSDITTKTGEFFHIREDDYDAFLIARQNIIDLIDSEKNKQVEPDWMDEDLNQKHKGKTMEEIDPADLDDSMCTVHKVQMKERDGKNGKFYSHAREMTDGSWDYCSGRGWKSEK